MSEKTGRKRFRVLTQGTIFKRQLLVLQHEVRFLATENISGDIECEYATRWVDSTIEDETVC